MKVCVILQARMGSARLPGKVLKEVLGKPLLEYQCERLDRVKLKDETIITTSIGDSDRPIVDFCRKRALVCFRGPEEDVLARFEGAALSRAADVVVRLTGDCPLIDPEIVDRVIEFYLTNNAHYDYVSNVFKRTYPRGMDCEVFSRRALWEAQREAKLPAEREHVTRFIYSHPERYRLGSVTHSEDQSRHRWTVDTPEDFELIRKILTELYPRKPHFTMNDVLALLAGHSEWEQLNAHVQQKETH